jgi:MtfA peptidase
VKLFAREKGDVFRRQLLADPFPKEWDDWLMANVAQYRFLSGAERKRLQDIARVIAAEKAWEACDGLKLTEVMKITVAAQAGLMLLGLDHDYFARVSSIVMFPREFELPANSPGERGPVVSGQAVDYGSVFLSWDAVISEARDPRLGQNLVIHEFAHQLDFLDGFTNGAPALANRTQMEQWRLVMQGTFQRLRSALQKSGKAFLGSYAATNPTEFFSVVSEKFFTVPDALRRNHPEVFEVLSQYYRVDPTDWTEEGSREIAGPETPIRGRERSNENSGELAESDFVDLSCPYCGGAISFPKEDVGRLRECPNCLGNLVVPEGPGQMAKRIDFPIRTDRLALERLESLDAEDLADLLSDSATLRYLEWEAFSLDEAEEWIRGQSNVRFPKGDESSYCSLAIRTSENSKMIGLATFWFEPNKEFQRAQFEIIIHRDWRRKGFGLEAVRALIDYAFDGLRAHRVVTSCDGRNIAARSFLMKAGFRPEGEAVQERFVKGEWVNTATFAMLRGEYAGGISDF